MGIRWWSSRFSSRSTAHGGSSALANERVGRRGRRRMGWRCAKKNLKVVRVAAYSLSQPFPTGEERTVIESRERAPRGLSVLVTKLHHTATELPSTEENKNRKLTSPYNHPLRPPPRRHRLRFAAPFALGLASPAEPSPAAVPSSDEPVNVWDQ